MGRKSKTKQEKCIKFAKSYCKLLAFSYNKSMRPNGYKTKVGEEIYYDYIKEINDYYGREIIDKYTPDYEDGGYAKFQLWEFMNIYGNYISMGFPNVIEPLDIYVEQ